MKTHMLWHGGSNYAAPYYSDLESFDTIAAAIDSFKSRTDSDPYYPCCYDDTPEDGGPSAWTFFGDKPQDTDDLYPDEVWQFGPRGGLTRCGA